MKLLPPPTAQCRWGLIILFVLVVPVAYLSLSASELIIAGSHPASGQNPWATLRQIAVALSTLATALVAIGIPIRESRLRREEADEWS